MSKVTSVLSAIFRPWQGPQSFCHSFIALSMIRCSKSAQSSAVSVSSRYCCYGNRTVCSKPI